MAGREKQIEWTPHRDPYQRARAAFGVAHMSNAKWRKVLKAIATADLRLARSEWKCIDSDHLMVHGMPRASDVLESRFADGQFQPFEYKWIEWVRFPRKFRPCHDVGFEVSQDVDELKHVLDGCGQLRLVLDDGGLTLYAYER